jgi:hypothetical protein
LSFPPPVVYSDSARNVQFYLACNQQLADKRKAGKRVKV